MAVAPILATIVCLTAWVAVTRFRIGAMLSPFSIFLLMLCSIFGIRPLLMLDDESYDSRYFYGYDISGGFFLASVLGLIGVVAFVLGYASARLVSTRRTRRLVTEEAISPQFPSRHSFADLHPSAPERVTVAAILMLSMWFAVMIVVGGGPSFIALLFAGRSEQVSRVLANVPSLAFAIPVVAALLIASVRWEFERSGSGFVYTFRRNAAYWIVSAACVVPPSALGTRRFLIPSVIIVLIGAASWRWTRRIKVVWAAAAAASFLALAIFPFVRSAGSRTFGYGGSDILGAMAYYLQNEGIEGVLDSFFLSYDTEMFNWVAYFAPRMGSSLEFGMGRGTFGDLIAQPMPASVMNLPIWNDYLLLQAFGGTCGDGIACPVPSIIGVLYTDLALPGLILGMFLLGIACLNFEPLLFRSHGAATAALLLAAGFSVVFARGNSMSQLWYGAQIWLVWLAVYTALITLSARPPVFASQSGVRPSSRPGLRRS